MKCCFTLDNAWKAVSVNCEHPATSRVDRRGHCCARDTREESVNCVQPERQR